MTLLLATVLPDGAFFAADTRSSIPNSGRVVTDQAIKLNRLTPTTIIATTGISGLGQALRVLCAELFLVHGASHPVDTQVSVVQQVSLDVLSRYRSLYEVDFKLQVWIGGYDPITRSGFVCTLNSENEFTEDWTRSPGQIVLKGPNTDRVSRLAEKLINSNPRLLERDNLPTLAHLLISDARSWSVAVGGQVMWATATKSGYSQPSFIQLDG